MPEEIDYDAIAKQSGGMPQLIRQPGPAAPKRETIDYDALAAEHGGAASGAPGPVERFVTNAWNALNPVPAIKEFINRPSELGAAQRAFHVYSKAKAEGREMSGAEKEVFERGMRANLSTPFGTTLPLGTEPAFAAAKQATDGDLAGAAGTVTGAYLLPAGAAAAAAKLKSIPVAPRVLPKNPNVAETAAYDYLESKGASVPAGLRTGSQYVTGVENVVKTSPLGAVVDYRARRSNTAALRNASQELLSEASSAAAVPEQAAIGVRTQIEGRIRDLNKRATVAYDRLRQIEADPAQLKTVKVGSAIPLETQATLDNLSNSLAKKPFAKLSQAEQKAVLDTAERMGLDVKAKPVVKEVALPVAIKPVKEALRPIYDRLRRSMPIAQQRASAGMKALENIMEAEDYLPASIADMDLSAIKAAARGADMPELRTLSQGVAAQAVSVFDEAVRKGVAQAGPEAIAALKVGRIATQMKYDVAGVLKQLREEPVQMFNQLTYMKDSGINLLRQVAKRAPEEMRQMGRAWLEDLFGQATAQGGFDHAGTLWQRWNNLGNETKQILFQNPRLREDLGKFFLGAKKLGEEFNTSRSGVLGLIAGHGGAASGLMVTNPLTGTAYVILSGGLAKMLYSPKAIRALTTGLSVPVSNKAAGAIAAGQIIRLAGEDAKPLQLPPPE